MDIYAPGGSHFTLESSASFWLIENETKCLPLPSFGEVSSVSFRQQLRKCLSHPSKFDKVSSALFWQIENKTKHLPHPSKFGEVLNHSHEFMWQQ